MRSLIVAAALALVCAPLPGRWSAVAQGVKVVGEDLRVAHGDGVQIFVRNKRPDGVDTFKSDRIAIMMHGATYPGTSFDLPLAGKSWMDYMAERGFDVYALDLPGYGRSTRPALMDAPADQNEPFMKTTEAAKALGAVVDYVLKRRGVDKVNLVGWSWGTNITASYTTENQDKVARLVLYAPVWLRTTPSLVQIQGKVGAYRVVSRDQALGRWLTGVPEDRKAALIPAGWFDMWADATFATDPKGEGKTLRAPNGVVQDGLDYWGATPPKAFWEPEKIKSPVLLVLGEWDRDTPPYMAQALYPLLVNAAWKRHVVLSEGTHTIVMEKNRMLLLRTVQQFLEEPPPTGSATQ
jgi:pimeloyl-ACP methyl ester carboxylesterase